MRAHSADSSPAAETLRTVTRNPRHPLALALALALGLREASQSLLPVLLLLLGAQVRVRPALRERWEKEGGE